jgi:hypothetical protein
MEDPATEPRTVAGMGAGVHPGLAAMRFGERRLETLGKVG